MAENNEVTAFQVIDALKELLDDKLHLEQCYEDEAPKSLTNYAEQEVSRSFKMLEEKLDAYVDQRIMKKLAECRLISILPVD